MRVRVRDHRLVTVLFTDIVGSTQVAAELGDRRWRVLLFRHHAIVRKELKRVRGRELDTAGDGFFAAFEDPSDAIRCACAVADQVRELGIEIRAGLNLGSAEMIGDKLGGMAVHAAARIMAAAGPGEVLVAPTVRDMVPGSGFTFQDRGSRVLRDVPGEWRLFAVTGLDGHVREAPPVPDAAAERRAAIQPPPLLQRRSGRITLGATSAALVAAAVVVPLATRSSSPPPPPLRIRGNAAARIDPRSGKLTEVRALPAVPVVTVAEDGAIWVGEQRGTVSKIDPTTGHVQTIGIGGNVTDMAVGPELIWVIDRAGRTLTPINAGSGVPGTPMKVQLIPTGVAFGDGAVWVAGPESEDSLDGVVYRIDQATNEVSGKARFRAGFNTGQFSLGLAFGEGAVWATDSGVLVKVAVGHAPGTGSSVSTLTDERFTYVPGGGPVGNTNPLDPVVVGAGAVWILHAPTATLYRIDPATGSVAAQFHIRSAPTGVAVGAGRVWISFSDGSVSAIDPGSNRVVATFHLGASLAAVTVGSDGAPWVAAEPSVSGR